MSVEEICALPVANLAEPDAHLYLWTINAYLEESYDVARAWGFEPSTMMTWVKQPKGCGLGGAFAIASEWCLFARRGKLAHKQRVNRNWWGWGRPYDGLKPLHSAKPEEFQTIVESVSPGPYLELFARRKRHGWASWGNEVANDVEMPNAKGQR